jgi:hypothetical protein
MIMDIPIVMKKNHSLAVLLSCVVAVVAGPSPAHAAVSYLMDDGSITHSIGVGASGGDLMVLNRFDTHIGGEDITNIQINWTGIADGTAATLVIYDDPNDDGNPDDLVLLNQTAVTTAGGAGFNNSFTDHIFPNTSVMGQFYVGALVTGTSGSDYPFGYDASNPDFSGVSLFFENSSPGNLDPANPNGTSSLSGFSENFITAGNFMIRATGSPGPPPSLAPEPSTALLILVGVALHATHRRRPARR